MKHIIYSNYNLDELYDDTRKYLMEEMGVSEDDEGDILPTDDEVWQKVYSEDELNYDAEMCSLKHFFKDKTCLFFGSFGRWDGTFAGGKIGSFEELYHSAIKDCAYIEWYDENGHLYLKCSHHDGTNYIEVVILTDKGCNFSNNWNYSYDKKYDFDEEEMHRRLISCSFLSRLPHYHKIVYGV